MTLDKFIALHRPALERDEVKHNLILAILTYAVQVRPADFKYWSIGAPGQCAVKSARRPIVIGDLDQGQCQNLAELTSDLDYPGVVGPELTARWFSDRAVELGQQFEEAIPQQIHAINAPPQFPGLSGYARQVTNDDIALFAEWITAFIQEAVPHDPQPSIEGLRNTIAEARHWFWVDADRPVSMAGIARRLKNTAAVNGVYTPPSLRGRGYAGSVTATVVEKLYAEGKNAVCLYTDLRNPYSNRCYARIGFEPVCTSLHIPRMPSTRAQPCAAIN
jgi:predicted GNAT family acetyltransferase